MLAFSLNSWALFGEWVKKKQFPQRAESKSNLASEYFGLQPLEIKRIQSKIGVRTKIQMT